MKKGMIDMAKKMLTRKIVKTDKLSMEGTLDLSQLEEGILNLEVEDEGIVNITDYIGAFDGNYVTIQITNKTDEELELDAEVE